MQQSIETGTEEFLAHVEHGVAVLTLNRPERLNALSPGIYSGLATSLEAVRNDDDVRVVMVTGAGRAFCAGGDVKRMNNDNQSGGGRAAQSHEQRLDDLQRRQREVSLALHHFPKPVVAAIPGAAAGAGLSIALAADLRIASPKALIITAFANIGASGDFGGSWFLTQLVGSAKAKDLYFRSPRLSAEEALDLGLVTEILDGEDFGAAAFAWCVDLANRAPLALRHMKENLNRAIVADLSTALDHEAENMVLTMSSDDHKEAAAAFVEKRDPVFRGR